MKKDENMKNILLRFSFTIYLTAPFTTHISERIMQEWYRTALQVLNV